MKSNETTSEVHITKYEQAAFTVQVGEYCLAVDFGVYTSPRSLKSAGKPTFSLVSHIHPDHYYPENLHAFGAPVVTVSQVGEILNKTTLTVHLISEGQALSLPHSPFSVTATPSDHGPYPAQPLENVGFLIKVEGKSIYFLGDMYTPSVAPEGPFDLVLIPVGNSNYTFGPKEAAEHITRLKPTGIIVPIHYDGSLNPATASEFAELVGSTATVRILSHGESITL
jgi:L-ascorbate metabolism protein UlaG (beta-lactamase superfamily)